MGDRNAVRKAGGARRILQIGDVGRLGLGQGDVGRFAAEPLVPIMGGTQAGGGILHDIVQAGRGEQHQRIAAGELHPDLIDIGFAAAKAGRQRQRHRQRAGIDGAKEGGSKAGTGFGDQGDAVTGLHAFGNEVRGVAAGIGGEFRKGVSAHQIGAGIVEVEALLPLRGVIQSITECGEIGAALRQRIAGGSGFQRRG